MGRFKLGLQLYTIRDEMEKDVDATLKKVSEMGYDCVEFAGYFDHSADELKAICEKYNLEIISVHQGYADILEKPDETISYVKKLGAKYYTIPWMNADLLKNEYDNVVDNIKKAGKILKDSDMQLMYHNHDFEFGSKRDGKFILDALYADVPSDLLIPEIDVCWVHYAGQNPVEYVKKYGNIMKILHLKDFECKNLASGPVYDLIGDDSSKDKKDETGFEFRPVGHGRQDMKAILKAAEDTAIDYLVVEQDMHPQRSSLEDAKISIDYLRSIGY